MRREPVVWKDRVWQVLTLLLVNSDLNAMFPQILDHGPELSHSFLGALLSSVLDAHHELVVFNCLLIGIVTGWLDHEDMGREVRNTARLFLVAWLLFRQVFSYSVRSWLHSFGSRSLLFL